MIMFPGQAVHCVTPYLGTQPRITLSWNLNKEAKQEFLSGCTVLSVPANYGEAFGLYVLEAMASGLPVVAYDVQGPKDIIQHRTNGLLVDTIDAKSRISICPL